MLKALKHFFTKDVGLKFIALVLALALWFYIVSELKKGTEEERRFLSSVLPAEGIVSKKLFIRPAIVGHPHFGFYVDDKKVAAVPSYCIVVGAKDLLDKIKYAYTMPIDISGASKSISRSVPLSPIAPGVFTEETLVQIIIPIEHSNQ